MLLSAFLTFLAVIAVATAIFFLVGPQSVWTTVAGEPDLGALDLTTVARSTKPHDGLICTDGLCPHVKVDLDLPAYNMAPAAALAAFEASAKSITPDLERVDDGSDPLSARYVTRSPTLKFPDTTWVEVVDMGDGQSGLRVYSRAQLGHSDLGANLKRITAWANGMDTD